MRQFTKGDKTFEFDLDIEKAIEIEKKYERNVLKEIEEMEKNYSMSSLDDAAQVWLGRSLKSLYADGLAIADVIQLVMSMITGTPLNTVTGLRSVGDSVGFTNPLGVTLEIGSQDGTSLDMEITDLPLPNE
jgi:hypothetical protein